MSDNFPSIGEPVLDPNEKHQENGIAKYDLPFADGGSINEATQPVLFSKYEVTGDLTSLATRESIVTLVSQNLSYNNSSYSFWDSVNCQDYNPRYSETYEKGEGLHIRSDNALSVSNEVLTVTDIGGTHAIEGVSSWKPSFLMDIVVQYRTSTGDAIAELRFLDDSPNPIANTILQYRVGDSGGWITPPGQGGTETARGVITVSANKIDWVSNSSATGPDDFSIIVDASDFTDVLINGSLSRGADAATSNNCRFIMGRYHTTANRPNMTSPDPLCPYRIVADLT